MGIFGFLKKKKEEEKKEQQKDPSPVEQTDTVEELEKAGYFKYAAESDIPEIKKTIGESLKQQYFDTVYNEHPEDLTFATKDLRVYFLDGETLFEEDGFTYTLKDFQHIFDVIGLKFEVTNHIEEYDKINDWLNHSMTVNGKAYVIFKNFSRGYGWGEAAQKLAGILNDQLELQGKDERLFLWDGGNDGKGILLTEEQFKIIDKVVADPHDKPLRLEDWCRLYEVSPM